MEEIINFKAVGKILNPADELLPDEDIAALSAMWNALTMLHSLTNRVSTADVHKMMTCFDAQRSRSSRAEGTSKVTKYDQLKQAKQKSAWSGQSGSQQKSDRVQKCQICFNGTHTSYECPLMINGPCEVCTKLMPREKVRHTTSEHKDKKDTRNEKNIEKSGP